MNMKIKSNILYLYICLILGFIKKTWEKKKTEQMTSSFQDMSVGDHLK